MKLIELHILQSFPVSCLNRDDVGSPKTAFFGGVNRARLSSQCMKHAIRHFARELARKLFAGERTRKAAQDLTAKLVELNPAEVKAKEIAEAVCHGFLSKTAPKKRKKDKLGATEGAEETESDTSTLLYFSPSEIDRIAEAITSTKRTNPETKDFKDVAARAVGKAQLKDAADIAVFGRMVANEASLTLEGAGMFSHALSTHKADNELDFWTAVDDSKEVGDDAGAANMGTIEFTSAVYYRYAALNLTMLGDDRHLKALGVDGQRKVVDAFIRATLMAVPGARKNSMNAHTLPGYVLGTYKSAGQPVQLINAFEEPVRPKPGLLAESTAKLKAHHQSLKTTWGITCDTEIEMPKSNLNAFCETLSKHVS